MADPAPPGIDPRGRVALGLVVAGIAAATWGAWLIGGLGVALLVGGVLVLVLGIALAWQ